MGANQVIIKPLLHNQDTKDTRNSELMKDQQKIISFIFLYCRSDTEIMKRFNSSFVVAAIFTAFSFCAFISPSFAQNKIRVALITGGHAFEAGPFYAVFNSIQTITYDTLVQPNANAVIASPGIDKYDVLVFYDMGDSLSASQQQAYIDLLKKRKAMIFLHHSLVSYQKCPEFIKIV